VVVWMFIGTWIVIVWVFVGISVMVEVLYLLKPPVFPSSAYILPKVLTGILLLFTFGTPQ